MMIAASGKHRQYIQKVLAIYDLPASTDLHWWSYGENALS